VNIIKISQTQTSQNRPVTFSDMGKYHMSNLDARLIENVKNKVVSACFDADEEQLDLLHPSIHARMSVSI